VQQLPGIERLVFNDAQQAFFGTSFRKTSLRTETSFFRAQAIFSSSVLQQQLRQHCAALEQPQAEPSQGKRTNCNEISDAIGKGAPVTTKT